MLTVTPIYLGLCALLYVALAARVVRQRNSAKVALGDGDDKELTKRIRAHGNFAEYAPILMILLVVTELQATPTFVLHILGILIFASRVGHAYFISQTPEPLKMRVLTMGVTLTLVGLMSLGLLGHAIF